MLRKSIVRDFHLLAEHRVSLRAQWLLRPHHRPSRPRILPLARAHFPQTRWLPAFALAIILKPIVYALRDNSPQGPPAIALLKPANLECSIFMMSPIYAMSMVGFSVKRFGASLSTAPPLIRNRQRGRDRFQQTHSTPASAQRLKTYT